MRIHITLYYFITAIQRSLSFTTITSTSKTLSFTQPKIAKCSLSSSSSNDNLIRLPESDVPIAFINSEDSTNYIDCYADSLATLDGVQYTIGMPCDTSVAICYFEDDQFIPIELDEIEKMKEIFPIVEKVVEEEFGEDFSLLNTPQTLTLTGDLDDDEYDEDIESQDAIGEMEEEVEIIVTLDHEGVEYSLVRMLDPVLLVGKVLDGEDNKRLLLTEDESDVIMPKIEELFLEFNANEEDEENE